ncbi:helix-turn-helix domain-containing protein [Streptomyces sp. NPDC002536]
MGVTEDSGWELDLDGESVVTVAAVGRQLRLWREAAGLPASELARAIGYSAELVYKVEGGTRIPKPDFLDRADEALGAGGKLAAMKKDIAEARYPKRVRDLAQLEKEAVELCSYNNTVIDGLLQTEAYARAVFGSRRPPFGAEQLEVLVAARVARQTIVDASTAQPAFSYVLCEATLRRPIGGRMAMRRQLEHLLKIGHLRNVDLQVLPLSSEENPGLDGPFRLLKLKDGTSVGLTAVQLASRVITDPREVQFLDLSYGAIRAQALTPRESLAFIENVLGET